MKPFDHQLARSERGHLILSITFQDPSSSQTLCDCYFNGHIGEALPAVHMELEQRKLLEKLGMQSMIIVHNLVGVAY